MRIVKRMNRHGGSVHLVRPDRVVRTGVLSPIVGYQPQHDVMSVTSEFTSGPASGMQLAGFGLGAMPGPIQRFWLRLKAAIAEKKAAKMMLTGGGSNVAHSNGRGSLVVGTIPGAPGAPMMMRAQGVAPQISAMHQMADFLAMRGSLPMRGEIYPQRRWFSYYYSG